MTTELRNRLAYALQVGEEHSVPVSTRREDGSWTSGIAVFTKPALVASNNMANGTSPGFVSDAVQKAVKDNSLQFVEIVVNRSNKEQEEAARSGDKKTNKKLATVLLLVASTSLAQTARDLKAAMKTRIDKIDAAFTAEYTDLVGLIEGENLIPVDQATSDISPDEAQIWHQIVNARPGIANMLNAAYVINLPNDGGIVTSDRFGTLSANREMQKSASTSPANADNGAPF